MVNFKAALADRRVDLVEGRKASGGKLFNGSTLQAQEIRKRIADQVQDKVKFEKERRMDRYL